MLFLFRVALCPHITTSNQTISPHPAPLTAPDAACSIRVQLTHCGKAKNILNIHQDCQYTALTARGEWSGCTQYLRIYIFVDFLILQEIFDDVTKILKSNRPFS